MVNHPILELPCIFLFGTEAMLLTAAIVPAIRNVFGLKPSQRPITIRATLQCLFFYKTNKKPKKQLNHY
jgi:uncharacterized membrane protein SpoIIM required for sporulation